jgi:hypothetical protein
MLKKIMLLAMAVGATIAFAAPAAARAATLSDPGPVIAGEWMITTSNDATITINSQLSITCGHMQFSANTIGEGEEVSAVAGGGTASECEVAPLGAPMTITSMAFEVNIDEEVIGFAFGYDALGAEGCTDEAEMPAEWTIGTDVVHIHGGPLLGTGAGCPAGAAEFHGTFTVTTTNGTPVIRTS